MRSLKNGKQYAVLNYNRLSGGSSVDVYDYITGKKGNTIVSSSQIKDANYFYTYTLSEDETKVLLATDLQQIYRRSTLGTYYVYDVGTKKMMLVSENKIQEPLLNPAGTKVAYGYDNNIFIKNLSTGVTTQITKDGLKNSIINGITDWVYEEEFAFVRAFEWNKDGSKIGYIKFDETNVPRHIGFIKLNISYFRPVFIPLKSSYKSKLFFIHPVCNTINNAIFKTVFGDLSSNTSA